eukprot:5582868-Amphidinium_carterae.1
MTELPPGLAQGGQSDAAALPPVTMSAAQGGPNKAAALPLVPMSATPTTVLQWLQTQVPPPPVCAVSDVAPPGQRSAADSTATDNTVSARSCGFAGAMLGSGISCEVAWH